MKYLVLYRKLRKIGEELGLRTTLSPHKLRRSYGVKFYAQENDLLGLQEQLRHACLTSTQKYAKTMPGPLRRQVEKMGGR
jgi:site-specific recombinase XerC